MKNKKISNASVTIIIMIIGIIIGIVIEHINPNAFLVMVNLVKRYGKIIIEDVIHIFAIKLINILWKHIKKTNRID